MTAMLADSGGLRLVNSAPNAWQIKPSGNGQLDSAPTPSISRPSYADPQDPLFGDVKEFFDSTGYLRNLRDFARGQLVNPLSVYGAVQAYAVAQIPPYVVLPSIIGGTASLNLFLSLVGLPGTGKGGSMRAAGAFLNMDDPLCVVSLGSGEGLAKLYAYKLKDRTQGWVQKPLRTSVFIDESEIDSAAAQLARSGANIGPQLRKAYSGEPLGHPYADPSKALNIGLHRYRLVLVIGVQQGRSGWLMDPEQVNAGTPQRFLWLPTLDPDMDENAPQVKCSYRIPSWESLSGAHPKVYQDPLDALDKSLEKGQLVELDVPKSIRSQIRADHVARHKGTANLLGAHYNQSKLKVAAGLMWLDHRTSGISEDDWQRADVVMRVSEYCRESMTAELAALTQQELREQGKRSAVRETEKAKHVSLDREKKVYDKLLAQLKKKDGQTVARLESLHFTGADRELVKPMASRAEEDGCLTIERYTTRNQKAGWKLWLRQ